MKAFIIGSGSWGTALGNVLADNGVDTLIYGRSLKEVQDINEHHLNSRYFPTVLNEHLQATNDLSKVGEREIVVLAVPSSASCEMAEKLNDLLKKPVYIINVAKGFHPQTHERLSVEILKILKPELVAGYCALIGPSHAEEVVERMHTTINMVSDNMEVAEKMQYVFSNSYFRVYRNDDMIGCEYAAGLKNIIAIASGILYGLKLGDNAKASLMTRGLAEMTRFTLLKGGKKETMMGLCGMGDLIVTCTSQLSRNFMAGYDIGQHNSAEHFWAENKSTVEGVKACQIIYAEAKKDNIPMPITEQVYLVLFENKKPSEALADLMGRGLKPENY